MRTIDPKTDSARLARDHQQLAEQCGRIERHVTRSCLPDELDRWCKDLVMDLRILEGQLLAHFRYEEQGGFLRDVLREVPHSERRVAALRREHDRMANDLDRILRAMESWRRPQPGDVRMARARIRRLLEGIERHEIEEQSLLLSTYYREYGTGD